MKRGPNYRFKSVLMQLGDNSYLRYELQVRMLDGTWLQLQHRETADAVRLFNGDMADCVERLLQEHFTFAP